MSQRGEISDNWLSGMSSMGYAVLTWKLVPLLLYIKLYQKKAPHLAGAFTT